MYLTETPGHLDLTDDGFDIQWGVNVIGTSLVTRAGLWCLIALSRPVLLHYLTAPRPPRWCSDFLRPEVSCHLHSWALTTGQNHVRYPHKHLTTGVDQPNSTLRTIKIRMFIRSWHIFSLIAYMQANIVLAQEFSRRYGEKGLVAMSVNPGSLVSTFSKPTTEFWLYRCMQNRPSAELAMAL